MDGMGSAMGGMIPPLTWHTAVTTWRFSPGWSALIALAVAVYAYGVIRARAREGRGWRRTVAFGCGIAVLAVSFNSAIYVYSMQLFWIHMILHLLLIMIFPILLVAGHPLALWKAAGGPPVVARLPRPVRAAIGLITFPVVSLGIYAVVIVGTHLTSFMQYMLTHMWAHTMEDVLYLASGYLFFLPLIGEEPVRWRTAYPLRLFVMFLGMMADTGVGVVLLQADHELWPAFGAEHRTWGPGLVQDIQWGGATMWVGGDGIMLLVMIITLLAWLFASAERQQSTGGWLESVRRSALAAHGGGANEAFQGTHNIDDDDAALDAYNAMLARMSKDSNDNRES